MSDQAAAAQPSAQPGDRGFARLDFELNDYPGPVKTALFGIQHVLVNCLGNSPRFRTPRMKAAPPPLVRLEIASPVGGAR